MDENTGSRRGRASAGASALGAAALLVLSFGPSALALSPSTPAPQAVRVTVSSPVPASTALSTAQRSAEEADAEEV